MLVSISTWLMCRCCAWQKKGDDLFILIHVLFGFGDELKLFKVNKIFASLSSDRPMWRSNWNISWSDDILAGYSRYPHRNPGISPDERAALFQEMRERIAERGLGGSAWLKVEYQTLRRLCNHPRVILFTVRTFLNSLDELKGEPLAAKALLQNLERLQTAEFRKYLGIDDEYLFESLRGYVKTCVVDVE